MLTLFWIGSILEKKASNGALKGEVFHSGQLFADLNVSKALLQGQVEIASPGAWTLTGLVPDCDMVQLPYFYGVPLDVTHKATDGKPGEHINKQLEAKLGSHVLGPWIDLGYQNWYATKTPLDKFAEIFGLSRRHVTRLFRQCTGMSIGEYRNRQRIETARRLLTESTLSIGEIAWRTGFESGSALARAMRRTLGVSPGGRVSLLNSCSAGARASPKSRSFVPVRVSITLPGFRSRWMTPCRCARSSASAISVAYWTTSSAGSGPRERRAASVSPSRYSMTRKSTPSWWPTSYSAQMCGWLRAAIACASRSKRARSCGSVARARSNSLIATVRLRRVSVARYT